MNGNERQQSPTFQTETGDMSLRSPVSAIHTSPYLRLLCAIRACPGPLGPPLAPPELLFSGVELHMVTTGVCLHTIVTDV